MCKKLDDDFCQLFYQSGPINVLSEVRKTKYS